MTRYSEITSPSPSNWSISARHTSSSLYALSIVDIKPDGTISAAFSSSGVDARSISAVEFVFNMNPRSLDLDEPAAVTIVPTQGGHYIEHQGSVFKNIVIAGTTGVRPNPKAANTLVPVLGIPNPFSGVDMDQARGLPQGERTGFDDIVALRNMFRLYYSRKKDPVESCRTVMIWQNGKDGEFFIVEPMNFRTRRDSKSPLTYEYEIQLRTIKRLDLIPLVKFDPLKERNALQRFNERLVKITREITLGFSFAEALIDRTSMIGRATIYNVLGPARAIINGLSGVLTAGASAHYTFTQFPRDAVKDVATEAKIVAGRIMDIQDDSFILNGVMSQAGLAANAYRTLARGLTKLHAEDSLFSEMNNNVISKKSKAYNNENLGAPINSGSVASLANSTMASATQNTFLLNTDNIYSVTQRLLGDQARWKELVLLNNLKPPYIDVTGNGTDVLRPGDRILFPADATAEVSGVAADLSSNKSNLIKKLGRDIKLLDTKVVGISVYDVGINNKGDLALIEGEPNMRQAIVIKFSTEQGTLPTHPSFGIQYPLGTKATVRSLTGFQLNARASLLADARIEAIDRLNFFVEGNVLTIDANLKISAADDTVNISFDARR